MIESLDVILWDKKVGTLVANREGHRSKACFYFDSDYVRNGYGFLQFIVHFVFYSTNLSILFKMTSAENRFINHF